MKNTIKQLDSVMDGSTKTIDMKCDQARKLFTISVDGQQTYAYVYFDYVDDLVKEYEAEGHTVNLIY